MRDVLAERLDVVLARGLERVEPLAGIFEACDLRLAAGGQVELVLRQAPEHAPTAGLDAAAVLLDVAAARAAELLDQPPRVSGTRLDLLPARDG